MLKLFKTKADPQKLYFGQQSASTAKLFGDNYHTVKLIDTPHYRFLKGNEQAYLDYLKVSWQYARRAKNTLAERQARAAKFKQLVKDIQTNGIKEPVIIYKRFDGKRIIYHGNHRAAVAAHLGIRVPVEIWPINKYLKIITYNPKQRYGSQLKDLPYQSVYYRGREILEGRRRDLLDRAALIDDKDLRNKTVLDIGCNIGVSSFNAAERGARKVYGYDVSDRIITTAIRINGVLALPCYFGVADFSKPVTTPRADTGFVFSIDLHVKNDKMLAQNIKRNVKEIVYFECHSKTDIPADIRAIFKDAKLIGHTWGGKRKFYRCTL